MLNPISTLATDPSKQVGWPYGQPYLLKSDAIYFAYKRSLLAMLDVHFHFDGIGKIILSFLHGLRKRKRRLDTPDDYEEKLDTLLESNKDIFITLLLQRNKEICVEPSVPQSWKQGDSILKVGIVPIDEEVFDVRKEPCPMECHLPQQWVKINRGMYKWAKRNKKKILSKGKHFL